MDKDWTWEDLVKMVADLIRMNSIETYLNECDECDGPMGSVQFIMEREYEMMKENLDEDINKIWDGIQKRIIEEIKKEEYAM